jgi:hypothetical protein
VIPALAPALFDDCVSCHGEWPAQLAVRAVSREDLYRAERRLADLAAAQTLRGEREGDDDDRLRRIEAKLDLLAAWLSEPPTAPPLRLPLQLSVRGACLPVSAGPAEATALGLTLADWLPLTVWLPARVIATAEGWHAVAFDPLPGGLADALDRLVFRWHRRALAESRRQAP